MADSERDKKYIWHEVLVSGLSNVIFNGILAWFLLRDGPNLGWGGESSFVVDIIATGLLLPLIFGYIFITLQRRKFDNGELAPISFGSSSTVQSFSDRFPGSAIKSAIVFGLIGLVGIAPLTLLGFYLIGVIEASPLHYAVFKGIWAGLMASILVVPMILIAMRNPKNINMPSGKD